MESINKTNEVFPPGVIATAVIATAITGACHMLFSSVCLVLAVAAAKGWLAVFLYVVSLANFMFAVIHLGNPLSSLSSISNAGIKK